MAKINPSGPVATGTANVVTIGLFLWMLAGSTVIALGLSLWQTTREILFSPGGAVFAVVWFLCLASSTLILMVRAQVRPRKVVTEWDCAHCLTIENSSFAYDVTNDENTFQYMLNFRNLGNGPIRFQPEEFRLQVGDRVSAERIASEVVIPRLSPKGVASGSLKKEALPEKGVITYRLIAKYGRHDGEFVRRYSVSGEINYRIENGAFIGGAGINSEKDEDL